MCVLCAGKDLKKMEEPSYFFKLSAYTERLIAHIKAHQEFVMPEARAHPSHLLRPHECISRRSRGELTPIRRR